MKTANIPREPVTIERLERALVIAARVVMLDGPIAAPLFERLERELAAMRADQDAVGRAKKLLESYRLPSNPAVLGPIIAETISQTR
jgi:hypothetical protein